MSQIDRPAPGVRGVVMPRKALLGLAILLVAFNLRPAVSTLAPVLPEVMASTGLSAFAASLMQMGPVLCFGLFAAAAPMLARRFGLERAALLCLLAVTLGSGLRGQGSIAALAIGTLLAGAGIGAANVLLPGLLKRDFADRTALMTGLYSMALCIGGTVSAGSTAILYRDFDHSWQAALAFWTMPALLALGCAALVWRGARGPLPGSLVARGASLWGDRLAWQVTAFMGLQSLMAYSALAWLAPILRERGDDAVTAGLVVALCLLMQVAAALPAPLLAARLRRQSGPAACSMTMVLGGWAGLLYAPLWLQWVFTVVMGLGMGAAFGLAVLFLVLRAPNAMMAARLSSMAQFVGYSVASLGPLGVGLLHTATGSWAPSMVLFGVGCSVAAAAGWLAGRNRVVRG